MVSKKGGALLNEKPDSQYHKSSYLTVFLLPDRIWNTDCQEERSPKPALPKQQHKMLICLLAGNIHFVPQHLQCQIQMSTWN